MLIWPLRMLGMWIGQVQRAVASGERIFEVLDEPEIADPPPPRELPAGGGALRFEGVTFGYDAGRGRCCTTSTSTIAARQHDRADRPHGLRQDDARVADPALLRRRRGPRARRRRRRARPAPRRPAPRDRRSSPRTRSCSRRRSRENIAYGAPGRDRRAGRRGRARGAGARVHRGAARRATTRSSASAASRSRADSASASRSRARCSSTRAS